MKPNVIVITGPTATGKTALSINIAKKFNGEVISADSRQIYRGLDISTGKVTEKETQGIAHHLIDIIDVGDDYSVQQWKSAATAAIDDILSRGKLPLVVGGTGFYIKALVDNIDLPQVAPNAALRADLEKLDTEHIFSYLKELAPDVAEATDPNNRHRLIRRIEIIRELGELPDANPTESPYQFLQIGLDWPWDELKDHIRQRTTARLSAGMVDEIKAIHEAGASWADLEALGFDQRYIAQHLQGQIDHNEMIELVTNGNIHYAKRQKTWFKRDNRIQWFDPRTESAQIMETIGNFLS
jgi:tRNA dimethylallyltransferase